MAWLLSPPFDSPFSPLGHLYLLPPTSLLKPTLWMSVGVLGCGEHLGNWLLARSVSLFLTTPLLLLVTFISFLPPLLCVTLWTSLDAPDCGEKIGNWLLAGSVYPFDSPFYPPGYLRLLPPSSILCVTLWTSLRDPGCGEHIGKGSLASSLSPLLIPPLLLLVTSTSLLPLLFSM